MTRPARAARVGRAGHPAQRVQPGRPAQRVQPEGGVAERAKPAVADLGVDPQALSWERSGDGDGCIEVAFPLVTAPGEAACARGDWVLMRVAGDPAGRILVFDRNEWECFLDGVRKGEFDDATVVD